jgi:lysophospholipase L1-like esterase
MKKILVVGDSLAGGLPHLNFCMQLREMTGEYSVTASAVGGDPLAGISKRLDSLVPETRPDLLIILAGANDIFLPTLRARGGNWRRLVSRIEKRGSLPIEDVGDFRELYSRTVEKFTEEVGGIILTTITCMGEDLSSEPNKRRAEYNAAIRELAGKYDLMLADTAEAFDDILKEVDDPSHYFLDDFYASFTDTFHTLLPRSIDRLSGRRGLVLTLDGVHFNRLGARTFAQTVYKTLCLDDCSA